MSIVKYLGKKQISRQLFKVCRLNNLETRSQIESYLREHENFNELKWCSPEDIRELENFIAADLLRLQWKWEIPQNLVDSGLVIQIVAFLLEKELLPGDQMEIFRGSLRIYSGKQPLSLFEMAGNTPEIKLHFRRTFSISSIIKILRSLKCLWEDLMRDYELDPASALTVIDEARAQQVNAKAGSDFSPEFLSLIFGIMLEEHFVLFGKPREVLAGNYMGHRHYWSGFYLLKKELGDAIDMDAFLQECYRMKHQGPGVGRNLNFNNFVSHFIIKNSSAHLEDLLPVVEEILFRELGLRVGEDRQLKFPVRAELPFRSYCHEALEAIGEPVPRGVVREKLSELHPKAFVDPAGFPGVMIRKYGFTRYKILLGLQKWYADTDGCLRFQDPAMLQASLKPYSRKFYRAERWQDLMDFVNAHGRLPKRKVSAEEDQLADFWKRQFCRAQQGKYFPEHLSQMEELERRFRSNRKYKPLLNWDERYAQIKAFTAARGGVPPQRAAPGEEKIFNNWLRDQRNRMKKGKLDQRQEVLIKHYDELYPYKTKKYYEQIWDGKYKELEEFVLFHSRAPKRHIRKEESLERWYSHQRSLRGRGELNRRQYKLIESIIDRYPLKDLDYRKGNWHERCTELEQFAQAHLHLPRFTVEEENPLNVWFTRQKLHGIRGKLDSEQVARLQRLTDSYEVPDKRETNFYERLEELKDFIAAHSRLPRLDSASESSLYSWVWSQLKRAKQGKLRPQQRELLKGLCAPYQTEKPDWNDMFRQVRAFAEANSRLPHWAATDEGERELYVWLRNQRTRLIKGRFQKREENLIGFLFSRFGKNSRDRNFVIRRSEAKDAI